MSDRCQIPLYEKHGLRFVTAMFEICSAYVDCGGEINFIDVFGILTCFYHNMGGCQLAEIIQYHAGINFLKNSIVFAAVPVDQADRIFQFTETCFFAPAHPVKLFDFFQGKVFFRKIGCNTDIGSVIKTNSDNPEFNIVIRTGVIQKIKIRIRIKDGIGIRIAKCFICMASGKCCSDISIEFAVRQIIGRKNAITVDILHADGELHLLSDQMCKSIKTLVATICQKDSRNRVRVTVGHRIKRCAFMKLLFPLDKKIAVTEHDIAEYEQLQAVLDEVHTESEDTAATLKGLEKRLSDISLLMKNISAYQQTKAVYMQYKKAKDKEKFLRGNESSIIIHEAAAKTLQAARNGGKLPDFKTLHTEYKELTEKKDKLYQEYGKLKKKVKQYDTIKQNVDSILRQAKQQQRDRETER